MRLNPGVKQTRQPGLSVCVSAGLGSSTTMLEASLPHVHSASKAPAVGHTLCSVLSVQRCVKGGPWGRRCVVLISMHPRCGRWTRSQPRASPEPYVFATYPLGSLRLGSWPRRSAAKSVPVKEFLSFREKGQGGRGRNGGELDPLMPMTPERRQWPLF